LSCKQSLQRVIASQNMAHINGWKIVGYLLSSIGVPGIQNHYYGTSRGIRRRQEAHMLPRKGAILCAFLRGGGCCNTRVCLPRR
jgi:hypothetical protein